MKVSSQSCLAVIAVAGLTTAAAQPQLVNGLAAIVNDKVITYADVDGAVPQSELEMAYLRFGRRPMDLSMELSRLRSKALELLVERELIIHAFENDEKYRVPEDYLEARFQERMREDFGDRAHMVKSLRERGVTVETYRRRLREKIIVDGMVAMRIDSSILISPYKIETYYQEHQDAFKLEDRVKARMIYLAYLETRDRPATRQLAEQIVAKLEMGTSFAELASEYSDGSQRREGGDLKWVERKTLREDLAEVVFQLKAGEHSKILEKPDGCYLLFAEKREPAHVRPLAEVRDEIEKVLKLQEQERLRKEWIDRLKDKSYIEIFPLK
jgi:parvulin-like peptidyl-prolyl isomerase